MTVMQGLSWMVTSVSLDPSVAALSYHYYSNQIFWADDCTQSTRPCAIWILVAQVNNALCKMASGAV